MFNLLVFVVFECYWINCLNFNGLTGKLSVAYACNGVFAWVYSHCKGSCLCPSVCTCMLMFTSASKYEASSDKDVSNAILPARTTFSILIFGGFDPFVQ